MDAHFTREASRRIAPIIARQCEVEGMLAHQITAETRYRRYAPKNVQEPAKTR